MDLGFRTVSTSTDKVSHGLYIVYRLEYVGAQPLPWETLESTLNCRCEELDALGQQFDVALIPASAGSSGGSG